MHSRYNYTFEIRFLNHVLSTASLTDKPVETVIDRFCQCPYRLIAKKPNHLSYCPEIPGRRSILIQNPAQLIERVVTELRT